MSRPISERSLTDEGRLSTIAQALAEGARALADSGTLSPRLDAEVLLAHALGCRRAELFARYDAPLPPPPRRAYQDLLARRRRGEPVHYIIGVREFWGLDFQVTPAVLIPRPETEHLVEASLARLQAAAARPVLLDVGTGSGCLAIALAKAWPAARAIALDRSAAALRVARENALRHGVADRVLLLQADGRAALPVRPASVDLIVCNPPYIPRAAFAGLPPTVRDFEPRRALTDEADGLSFYRKLIPAAREGLRPGGHLIFELGAGMAEAVKALFDPGPWEVPDWVKDLQGIDRCLIARCKVLNLKSQI